MSYILAHCPDCGNRYYLTEPEQALRAICTGPACLSPGRPFKIITLVIDTLEVSGVVTKEAKGKKDRA